MALNLGSITTIINGYRDTPSFFKRNIVKEYLHIRALSFIYSNPLYQNLIFYGGSCLRHLYNLQRLSEDLDFVDVKNVGSIETLAQEITAFFSRELGVHPIPKVQKFRTYLKFPILYELGLAKRSESNFLFIKIEICPHFPCKEYTVEMVPLFKFNTSVIVRTFDVKTLFASKLNAVLNREWEKTDKTTGITVKGKGRDFFDLMWYLQRGVEPNIACVQGIKTYAELKARLISTVEQLDTKSIRLDLESLIADPQFVKDISVHIKEILLRLVNEQFLDTVQ